jgi:hypothetical protein
MSAYPKGSLRGQRAPPERGRPRADVLAELTAMAREEDAFWETGKFGTMYCGDHEHQDFMTGRSACSPTERPPA